ncbi:LysM peptidoglycan-binding domain-containing protein [Paracoccus subflavus]|uniref:LysM peptidoglycan-binding domain-containing protein n=1 Tax=Paracoccus subflavus TaxID=2528244 RepID=A0A4Q9G1F0_9RHOB|nr:LysM peptidoglycan-binding domain-containing protein [Paracoccus subflavus]TBN41269.1 LysM peptidoglycan-binding domain-containing protein [Paracoccus subflavus]
MSRTFRLATRTVAAVLILSSCGATGFDADLRGWLPGALSTADAAARAAPRPQPDERGIISFPAYQLVVARAGDTPATVAARLGVDAARLAQHNALPADAMLGAGQTLVLPQRVGASVGGTAGGGGTGAVRDPFAGQSAGNRQSPAAASGPAAASASANPRQHVVAAGETPWSIARRYDVGVQDLAVWNGLPASMTLRVGQRLVIPVAGRQPPDRAMAATTLPGTGSPTPRPPSASEPLPSEDTAPAADPGPAAPATDLGATRTAASSGGRFRMPVSGSIIRVYEKGRNDGIDISATAGTPVTAAGTGTVAAVTQDAAGSPIAVIRHDGGLMTVYAALASLDVAKGDVVDAGQAIGKAGSGGFVHFEVRRGLESLDPEDFLN